MRTFKSILLAGAMLLATPVFFSSCEEDGTLLRYKMEVTVVNDFNEVVDALNNGSLTNEQAIAQITAAINNMDVDQQTKLQTLMDAITSVNNTIATKLAVIEAALKAQTISLEGKMALIEQVINNQNTTLETKLGAIEAAMKEQTVSMEAKMDLLKSVLADKNTTLEIKLGAIAATMREQTIALTEKMKIIESAMKDQKTAFETKIDIFANAVMNLPKYEDMLEGIKTALISVNPNEQLKLLEGVLEKYFSDELKYPDSPLSYKGKLYYLIAEIEDTMYLMTYKSDKFKAIRKAIEKLAGENAKLDGILDNMTKIVEAIKAGNTNEKEGWAEFAKLLAQLKTAAGIGGSTDNVEYVDLGLPSGNLWAKCNLGASAPEAYGDYYAWGETKPKQEYTYPNHKWYKEGAPSLGFTKYNNEDGKMTLEDEDDAVIQNLGNGWRTPTLADFRELTNKKLTTIKKTTLNGVAGYQITSKKNGKSIFIPFAGFKRDKPQTREISADEEVAVCMTNLRRIDDMVYNAWTFAFQNDRIGRYGKLRPDGISIRPVKGPGVPVPNNCVDLGLASGLLWAKCNMGTTDPTKPGDYYAWGEIETKKKYSDNYKFYGKSSLKDGVIKYNRRDGKMVLELEDDAANVVLGVGYRIPTKEDWQELFDECKWEAETVTLPEILDPSQTKVIKLWKVTGPNGNSITLPNSNGYKFEKGYEKEDYTFYTTSTLRPRNEPLFYDYLNDMTAWTVRWSIEAKETSYGNFEKPYFDDDIRRMCGFVIRPVFDLYSNK